LSTYCSIYGVGSSAQRTTKKTKNSPQNPRQQLLKRDHGPKFVAARAAFEEEFESMRRDMEESQADYDAKHPLKVKPK
jgi:hypothetical protein